MVSVVKEKIEEPQNTMFVYLAGDMYCDKKNYLEYKNGMGNSYANEDVLNLKILELLDKNGFSLDCFGTYLYKDVIKSIMECLKKTDLDVEVLKRELSNPYSQFYFDISRNDRDMGVKTFHSYIEEAILNVCEENNDSYLLGFMCSQRKMNYGELAYEIANYMMNPGVNIDKAKDKDKEFMKETRSNIKKLTKKKK